MPRSQAFYPDSHHRRIAWEVQFSGFSKLDIINNIITCIEFCLLTLGLAVSAFLLLPNIPSASAYVALLQQITQEFSINGPMNCKFINVSAHVYCV